MGVLFYIVICNEFEHYFQTRLNILMNVIDIALFVLGWGVWLGEANNNVLVFVFLIQFSWTFSLSEATCKTLLMLCSWLFWNCQKTMAGWLAGCMIFQCDAEGTWRKTVWGSSIHHIYSIFHHSTSCTHSVMWMVTNMKMKIKDQRSNEDDDDDAEEEEE